MIVVRVDTLDPQTWTAIVPPGNYDNVAISNREASAQLAIRTAADDATTEFRIPAGSEQGIEIQGIVTTAGTLQLEYGTGTTCGTGKTAVTPAFVGSTTAGNPWSVVVGSNLGYVFKTPAGQALCVLSTTTTTQKVFVSYAQQ